MRNFIYTLITLVLLTPVHQSCNSAGKAHILVFSSTKGYRHASIEKGQVAIKQLGADNGFAVTTSEDPGLFTDESLKQYTAVVFLSTTGDILDSQQESAFMRYIQAGGGFVGIHAAADTEYGWPWYGKLVGAYFKSHPKQQNATIKVTCDGHDACAHLPAEWKRWDEWYSFRDVAPDLKIIASLDETSYEGGNMNGNHPIAWYHDYDGGRAFYTGLGHTDSSYLEPAFLQHVLGGIEYAMTKKKLDYSKAYTLDAPEESRLEKTVLASNLDEPMELDVMSDGSVLIAERKGNIKLYNPNTGLIEYVASMPVHNKYEDGLLGLALDPDYDNNHFIYLFYSPVGDKAVQQVSRFVFKEKTLDRASEKLILEIPVQRDECCHSAGYLNFGKDGLLYISVGDNTNPFASDGYSPIDERPGRLPWDAQKSSANTNDLRGKILRIKLKPDGSYEIPEGNLFKPGTPLTRPEIFVMGCRNPFRFSLDAKRKLLHWGDVGPDAGKDSVTRGPKGYDYFAQVGEGGGFFGWPYIRGNGHQYHDYDFATKVSGPKFDPDHLVNNSPNNTGMQELPPYKAPKLWYSYDQSREFPFVGTGGKNPMAGPVYYRSEYNVNDHSFPEYFDGKLFIYEWMRRWIYIVTLDKDNNFSKFDSFMPSTVFANPMDMKFGPDGSLYILNYGTAWFARNADAQLFKINYNGGNRQPLARMELDKYTGAAPLTLTANAGASMDADNDKLKYQWMINGRPQATGAQAKLLIATPGNYDITLEVTDEAGAKSISHEKVLVGNEMPEVKIEVFGNKTFFWEGRQIPYTVTIQDKEDGSNESGTLSPQNIQIGSTHLKEGQDLAKMTAEGHLAGMNQSPFESGRLLIEKSDCKTCHNVNQAINGPSYTQVSQRYQGKEGIETVLAQKILKGGLGNWGDRAMAAHPQHTEGEVKEMVKYILSLSAPKSDVQAVSSMLSGVIDVKDATGGTYVISAGYTDRGSNGITPLSKQTTYNLKSPVFSTFTPDQKSKNVSAYQANGAKLSLVTGKGYIGYNDIDFKDLKALDITYVASMPGKVEIFIDNPETGTKIGETGLTPSDIQAAPKVVTNSVDLKFTRGSHPIYLVFTPEDSTAQGAIFAPSLLEFKFKEGL